MQLAGVANSLGFTREVGQKCPVRFESACLKPARIGFTPSKSLRKSEKRGSAPRDPHFKTQEPPEGCRRMSRDDSLEFIVSVCGGANIRLHMIEFHCARIRGTPRHITAASATIQPLRITMNVCNFKAFRGPFMLTWHFCMYRASLLCM